MRTQVKMTRRVKKYHPPTKFCVFPSMGYWAIDGNPVSSREALDRMSLCDRLDRARVDGKTKLEGELQLGQFTITEIEVDSDKQFITRPTWEQSEVARELHLHVGWLEDEDEFPIN
tara:strand:- start:664 stop:1011 length:348 start_codon:yes stop_codon:yes gene_type:complete